MTYASINVNSEALVQLALQTLSCSQKALALRLGVSPTQISKWKRGEYISSEMENKIRELANLGDKDPKFVLWVGSVDTADKWEKLIHFLAKAADEDSQTGYGTDPLRDEFNLLCGETFSTLKNMGVDLPEKFPAELDVDYEDYSGDLWDLIDENSHSSLIYRIYKSLTNVYGFYAAYVSRLVLDDGLDLHGTGAENIEPCLLELAASKIDVDEVQGPATKFREFRHRVKTEYAVWLNIVKERAYRAGVPLRAELLQMVYESGEALGHEAERESLGFNSSRLHPDVYMDELLCGMRVIHQILPAMMKRLGMEDFRLDDSELHLS